MPARLPIVVLALTAALAVPAAANAAKPNLAVSATTGAPASLQEGAGFTVKDTTVNRGRARAARTATRFYLSTDPKASIRARRRSKTDPRTSPQDIPLTGARDVPALAPAMPRRRGRPRPSRSPPARRHAGTPAGRYTLVACADDRGAVTEQKEDDNCRAAAGKPVQVKPTPDTTSVHALSDLFDMPSAEADAQTLAATGPAVCATKIPTTTPR